jgi:hypothetical protein
VLHLLTQSQDVRIRFPSEIGVGVESPISLDDG